MRYDGSIKFDTSIDTKKFETGVAKLKSTAVKGMAVVGSAFTAAAGYAVNLASDLQEVQNVVDVTFGNKAADIDAWAKNAANAFGLSELQAKQFNGTMGAMVKSMGLSQDAVFEMSTTLTSLTADFASFYNLEHQEAFDKIRAGISGETEPLKQLGINMSVANLEAYALSQGITKTYKDMSQAEQATLRYNYILKAGADAQGDFARTSDSFANQLRIAKLNVTELASGIGESLLPIASKGLNEINSSAKDLTASFKSPELETAIASLGTTLVSLIKTTIELAGNTIPKLVKGLAGLAENMRLVGSAGIALYAGYKTFDLIKTATPIIKGMTAAWGNASLQLALYTAANGTAALSTAALNGTLTLGEVAVGALTGKIELATAAQALWNKVKLADPSAFVIAGVVALTVAIGALILTQEKEKTSTEIALEKAKEHCEVLDEEKQKYDELKNAQAKQAGEDLAQVERTKALCDELQTLADENGKVEDANRSRVNFILNELNNAYGTEYKMIDGVIIGYQDMQTEIDNLIAKKKWQIAEEAALPLFEKAVEGGTQAYADAVAAEAAYAEQRKVVEEHEAKLAEIRKKWAEIGADDRSGAGAREVAEAQKQLNAEKKLLEEKDKARKKSNDKAKQMAADYADYQEAATLAAEGNYEEAFAKIQFASSELNKNLQKHAGDTKKQQEDVTEAYAEAAGGVEKYLKQVNNGEVAFDETFFRMLVSKVKETYDKGAELGISLDEGIALGVGNGQITVNGAVTDVCNKAVEAAKKALNINSPSKVARDKLGKGFSLGVAQGISLGGKDVSKETTALCGLAMTAAKKKLKINSPAKVPKDEIGKMISLGVAEGIKENSDAVVEAFEKQFDKLNYQRDFDIINEEQYYTELEKLRDQYFAVGTKEWLDYTLEIDRYQKQLLEDEKEKYKETYDEIFDYASEKIDAVIEKQEEYSKKLKSYGNLFNKNTIKLDEGDIEFYSLADIRGQIDDITKFNELMSAAREKAFASGMSQTAVDSMLSEFNSLDIIEGTGMLTALLSANDKDLADWFAAYDEKLSYADSSSAEMFKSEMDAAIDKSTELMKQKLSDAGFEIPTTFFNAGKDSANKFGEAFSKEIDAELSKIKQRFDSFNCKIQISIEKSESGSGKVSNDNRVYSDNRTTNIYASSSSPHDIAEATRQQSIYEKHTSRG